jgi:hypothetical protein
MKVPDLEVGKRLFVGLGNPECLGRGPLEIRGSSYIEGPSVFGAPIFPNIWATVMIGPNVNFDSPPAFIPGALFHCQNGLINNSPYSLAVIGDAAVFDDLHVNGKIVAGGDILGCLSIKAQGVVTSKCGKHKLHKKKNFDIPHPTKEGWRLRHTCPEGPSNDVYFRGRVTGKKEIDLPEYWKNFVDIQSITVNLQPIGAHQDVIIKRIDETKIYLQSKGGMPIDCYYHVYGTRSDGDVLVSEYQGLTPDDYPGDNSDYNVNI